MTDEAEAGEAGVIRPTRPIPIVLISLSLGLTAASAVGIGGLWNDQETLAETLEYMAVHAFWVSLAAALFFSLSAMLARRRSE